MSSKKNKFNEEECIAKAKEGSEKAMLELANRYSLGIGVKEDESKAYYYSLQASKFNHADGVYAFAAAQVRL